MLKSYSPLDIGLGWGLMLSAIAEVDVNNMVYENGKKSTTSAQVYKFSGPMTSSVKLIVLVFFKKWCTCKFMQ